MKGFLKFLRWTKTQKWKLSTFFQLLWKFFMVIIDSYYKQNFKDFKPLAPQSSRRTILKKGGSEATKRTFFSVKVEKFSKKMFFLSVEFSMEKSKRNYCPSRGVYEITKVRIRAFFVLFVLFRNFWNKIGS